MTVVDVHTHFVPDFVFEALASGDGRHGLSGDEEFLSSPAGRLPLHFPEMRNPAAKLDAMDARGVDESIVSLTPHLFISGEEHDPISFAERSNDALAAFVTASPRLDGLATVPLGQPDAAASELRRAVVDLGLRGAIIGTGLSDEQPLDRIGLDPRFAAAVELGVPLFVHPFYCGLVSRPEFFLNNSLGVPFDTAWAVARLMVSGTLDRHPRLKLLLPHGGGALPSLLGRLDNAWERRPGLANAARRAPSGYLDQLWFDSVTHEPKMLAYLAGLAGVGRVLLGTDSPYLTGDPNPRSSFERAGLDHDVAGASARELFRLPPKPEDEAVSPRADTVSIVQSCTPGAGALASPEVRDAIVAQESLLLGPVARTDPEMLEQLIHRDFDEIGRTGYSWVRAEVISKLQSVSHQTKHVEFGRVIELAPGVAHIRFRTDDDRGIVHRSSIWVNDGVRWQQRYHQGTPDTQEP